LTGVTKVDAVGLDADEAILVERADGLLEGLFAEAEGVADFLGQAAVVEREAAAGGLELGEDGFTGVGDAAVAGAAEGEVHLAVGPDVAHVTLDDRADLQRAGDVRVINQAAVGVVDDEIVAEWALAGDEQVHRLAFVIGRRREVEAAVEAGAGDEAVGLVIEHHLHDDPVAGVERAVLLAGGQEQILAEAPVEKEADAGIDADHLQIGELADDGVGFLRGGDEAVLGVAVDKHLELVARHGTGRDVFGGQEDFAM
jgi:hypothetical protein